MSKLNFKNRFIEKYLFFFIIIGIWIIGSYFSWWNNYIIPYPQKVFTTFLKLLKTGELFKHLFISVSRIFLGFSISTFIAIPSAIIFAMFPKIYNYFKNFLEFMKHTPPFALIPIIILWFGIGEISKIIIIILASFFPVFLNTFKGIKNCDKKLIEVGYTFNLTKFEIFKKIILPSAIPDILTGIKLGIGYSWRSIIGAEMIAASSGIGYLILDGQQMSRSDIIIIGILSIGIFGIFTDYIFSNIIKIFLKKRGFFNEQ